MFVTDTMIDEMAAQYGMPERRRFHIDVSLAEHDRIHASQKEERNHDVTLYVQKADQYIVIAKPFYPPGLYRAPSGGLQPNESFLDGIGREMTEEIGCTIALDRFILRTEVTFSAGDDSIFWRSFVFLAHYLSGDFQFTDKHEIREVRLADWREFDDFGRIMRSTDIGGLHYRAALHDAVAELV